MKFMSVNYSIMRGKILPSGLIKPQYEGWFWKTLPG